MPVIVHNTLSSSSSLPVDSVSSNHCSASILFNEGLYRKFYLIEKTSGGAATFRGEYPVESGEIGTYMTGWSMR